MGRGLILSVFSINATVDEARAVVFICSHNAGFTFNYGVAANNATATGLAVSTLLC